MRLLLFANTDWYLYNFRLSLVQALEAAGHKVILVSPAGEYGTRLRSMGHDWRAAPMDRRSLNPLRELALLAWLSKLLRSEDVDLVHGFTIKCAVYGGLAAKLAGTPGSIGAVAGMGYVFTSNDTKARLLRPLVRGLMRLALDGPRARLILQNPDDVQLFARSGLVKPERIRQIAGSGVDCGRFHPADQPIGGSARPLRVLLPARLLWDKGLAEYVGAARILKAEGRAIEFLLAGEPDPGNPAAVGHDDLAGWVEQGLVRWLGHVEDMPGLLREVDLVTLPSYREGLPKGLIEAAACGLPLVTTDVPGCREVVTHGVEGLLVPSRDADALAAAIARMHDDPGLRSSMGQAARRRALAEHDHRSVVARTLEVYSELLPG